MPRYVDVEKLLVDNKDFADREFIHPVFQTTLREIVDEQPTADVEPIIHAHWIRHEWAEEVEDRLIPNYECSHCHEWFRDNRRRCGECGAKMDEAVKDDD